MELSEPATAVALLLRDSLPNLNGKDQKLLEKWWKSKKWQKALLSKKIEMSGNDLSATKKGLSDKEVKGGKDLKTALTNAAVGISAATLAIHRGAAAALSPAGRHRSSGLPPSRRPRSSFAGPDYGPLPRIGRRSSAPMPAAAYWCETAWRCTIRARGRRK